MADSGVMRLLCACAGVTDSKKVVLGEGRVLLFGSSCMHTWKTDLVLLIFQSLEEPVILFSNQ